MSVSVVRPNQMWTPSPVATVAVRAMQLGRFAGSGVAADCPAEGADDAARHEVGAGDVRAVGDSAGRAAGAPGRDEGGVAEAGGPGDRPRGGPAVLARCISAVHAVAELLRDAARA
ncbi:hypothetical protein PSD17_67930 [Pseudonocardia sp. D17]|nr:hypothetical protein PSD17_67930 [Pseudonocardia sp. D17]